MKERVNTSSAAGWQSALGLLKVRGTLNYLYLIIALSCLYLCKPFGPLSAPQIFHGVTCDSAIRFPLEDIIKIT